MLLVVRRCRLVGRRLGGGESHCQQVIDILFRAGVRHHHQTSRLHGGLGELLFPQGQGCRPDPVHGKVRELDLDLPGPFNDHLVTVIVLFSGVLGLDPFDLNHHQATGEKHRADRQHRRRAGNTDGFPFGPSGRVEELARGR
ncbi:hypothetical protein D3C81_1028210 [compost metagenome]